MLADMAQFVTKAPLLVPAHRDPKTGAAQLIELREAGAEPAALTVSNGAQAVPSSYFTSSVMMPTAVIITFCP